MAYGEYHGRNLGRLLHFLYKMTPNSDYWTFDSTSIYSDGKCQNKLADYTWDGDSDFPTFNFLPYTQYDWINERQLQNKKEVEQYEKEVGREPYKYAECTNKLHSAYDAGNGATCPACVREEQFHKSLRKSEA